MFKWVHGHFMTLSLFFNYKTHNFTQICDAAVVVSSRRHCWCSASSRTDGGSDGENKAALCSSSSGSSEGDRKAVFSTSALFWLKTFWPQVETTIDRFKPHPMIMWKINISLLQEDTVRDEGLDWGQHSWTALNGRVSSWSSADGSPLWASRLPPPETRSLSISRSDRGSHSETCGTQDGRAVNSILANNTDMIFSFYLIKTPQNVQ